jgi:hypothetical protein
MQINKRGIDYEPAPRLKIKDISGRIKILANTSSGEDLKQ